MNKKALFSSKIKTTLKNAVFVCALFLSVLVINHEPALARSCGCVACNAGDCASAPREMERNHQDGRQKITRHIAEQFTKHRDWLVETFFKQHVLPALQLFTEQMSVVAMQQVEIIGTFLDAKHQLETQRVFQKLQAEAHKDYHPSEDFCWFGTNVRSLAHSESISRHTKIALNQIEMARHLGVVDNRAARNRDGDREARWERFASDYCDEHDNNWQGGSTGLALACLGNGALDGFNEERANIDIDYTRLVDEPRTIPIDFHDGSSGTKTNETEDVMAMANNLYGHLVLTRKANEENLKNIDAQHLYLALRSVAAKRNVAQNSFNSIIGLKSSGSSDISQSDPPKTREYMAAVLKELGIPTKEIFLLLGEEPSYYAQLEILAKKIYQNPDFFANLYDKPANVARKRVALKAVELMLDREIYESQIRQEMVMSVLLASKLRPEFRDVNKEMLGLINAE